MMNVPTGWKLDEDNWLVRPYSPGTYTHSLDSAGFIQRQRVFCRSAGLATLIDANSPIPANWWETKLAE